MADSLPKVRLYMLITIIIMLFNVCYYVAYSFSSGELNIVGIVGTSVTSFIPGASFAVGTLTFSLSGTPVEVIALYMTISGLLNLLQGIVLALLIASLVSNVLWSPDV